jgi:FlaA1/EpsC-like NDP-sugar epimerase
VQLVIQAGAIGNGGEALVLDMGTPVRISEVAEQLISMDGRDIAIRFTGLRPGEKLHEDLFGDGERDHRPIHPMISHVPVPPLDPSVLPRLGTAPLSLAEMVTAPPGTSVPLNFVRQVTADGRPIDEAGQDSTATRRSRAGSR